MGLLFGLSVISGAIVVAAASVVGLALSGSGSLATLPVTLSLLGAMSATVPIAHLMQRRGRRIGFAAGTVLSTLGALLAAAGIYGGSFALFCVGSFLLGTLAGVAPYYRFAAVEVTSPDKRARAIGFVLAGGVGAGLVGPPLAAIAKDWVTGFPFAGAYLAMAALGIGILALLSLLRVPAPARSARPNARPLFVIARQPLFRAATLAAVTAFAAMIATMVAAPLSLHARGYAFGATALVIQAHVVAMYAPSFFSGTLVSRFGPGRIMGAGLAFLAACVAVNLLGHTVAHHWSALVLLGCGWNLLFVAATALLTTCHLPEERAKVQGANDLLVASSGALASLAAGPMHTAFGWTGLNLIVLGLLAVCAATLLVLMRPRAQPPPLAAAHATP